MELPWFAVDCSTAKERRGERSALPTSACATSETPRPGSGRPAPRGTGLCFTFVSVSAALQKRERANLGRLATHRPASPRRGGARPRGTYRGPLSRRRRPRRSRTPDLSDSGPSSLCVAFAKTECSCLHNPVACWNTAYKTLWEDACVTAQETCSHNGWSSANSCLIAQDPGKEGIAAS